MDSRPEEVSTDLFECLANAQMASHGCFVGRLKHFFSVCSGNTNWCTLDQSSWAGVCVGLHFLIEIPSSMKYPEGTFFNSSSDNDSSKTGAISLSSLCSTAMDFSVTGTTSTVFSRWLGFDDGVCSSIGFNPISWFKQVWVRSIISFPSSSPSILVVLSSILFFASARVTTYDGNIPGCSRSIFSVSSETLCFSTTLGWDTTLFPVKSFPSNIDMPCNRQTIDHSDDYRSTYDFGIEGDPMLRDTNKISSYPLYNHRFARGCLWSTRHVIPLETGSLPCHVRFFILTLFVALSTGCTEQFDINGLYSSLIRLSVLLLVSLRDDINLCGFFRIAILCSALFLT